jgi:hypothetical protein
MIRFIETVSADFERMVRSSAFFSRMRMTESNLRARHVDAADTYLKQYLGSVIEFSPDEKRRLLSLTRRADALLSHFPVRNLRNIPWKFAKLRRGIERGYPHTLGDVIFIGEGTFGKYIDVETLIHEKVHVFQRIYEKETEDLIVNVWKYRRVSTSQDPPPYDARNNPDLDGCMYAEASSADDAGNGSGDNHIYYMAFSRPHAPRDIYDCQIRCWNEPSLPQSQSPSTSKMYEHPFERMAYEVASCVMREQCLVNSPLYDWMWNHI